MMSSAMINDGQLLLHNLETSIPGEEWIGFGSDLPKEKCMNLAI
jgi:hypothetical protein